MAHTAVRMLLPKATLDRVDRRFPPQHSGPDKRKNVGNACESCQRRRTKCTGLPAPCQSCRSIGTRCTFKPSLDGRKVSYRGVRKDLIVERRLLATLVQILRHGSREQVDGVVDIIRARRDRVDTLEEFQSITTSLREVQACLLPESTRGQTEFDASPNDPPRTRASSSSEGTQMEERILWTREEQERHQREPGGPLQGYEQEQEDHTSLQTHPCRHRRPTSKDLSATGDFLSPSPLISVSSPSNSSSNGSRHDCHPALQRMEVSLSSGSREIVRAQSKQELAARSEIVPDLPARFAVNIAERIPGSRGGNHCSPYSIPTLITHEDTLLGNVITKYGNAARSLLAGGVSHTDILGSAVIDVDLFFRDRTATDTFSVCNWASEIWRSFDDWDIYVRLAHVLAYTAVMRWQLTYVQEYYVAMPDILKPRAVQYSVPHDIALDFLPLPPLRESLIKAPGDWMRTIASAGLSVNWDRGMDEAVVRDSFSQRRQLSKDFIAHVVNYQNWSIGESILAVLPKMLHSIRLHRISPGSQ